MKTFHLTFWNIILSCLFEYNIDINLNWNTFQIVYKDYLVLNLFVVESHVLMFEGAGIGYFKKQLLERVCDIRYFNAFYIDPRHEKNDYKTK